MNRSLYPFPAVLGQEEMKNALIWNFVNPRIGGVLISGQKGTAKSTLVRASEEISGRSILELPLNTTEDRLVGAIDFEYAIRWGKKKLNPGILAQAHNQILYVDEINLLSDNLAKALLEAASDGWCQVEREGISQRCDCDFLLIGSMNPEESGLRPQLLDRFGLFVSTAGVESPLLRCEIVRRRLAFEADPQAFRARFREETLLLNEKIRQAQALLPSVTVSDAALRLAGQLAQNANCQGSRGELAIIETARAICALQGIRAVNKDAILEAAKYALPHRMQESAPPQPQEPPEPQEQEEDQTPQEETEPPRQEPPEQAQPPESQEPPPSDAEQPPELPDDWEAPETCDACGDPFQVGRWLEQDFRRLTVRQGSGRRSLVKTDSLQGRYVKAALHSRNPGDIAFDSILRAAAPYQSSRDKQGMALSIRQEDLRYKIREKRTGSFIVFVVDASGSMGVGKRMSAVKGAILSLLSDAYQKRDKVALVTFRKDRADLVLGMTRSVDLAAKKLGSIATGGRTPLYAGIEMAHTLVSAAQRKEKDLLPVVVLVTDGRATAGRSKKPFLDAVEAGKALTADRIKTVVIDVEQDFIKLKLAEKLADEMDAELIRISDLHAGAIVTAVRLAQNL